MWTFKSKFAAWALHLAEGVGAAPTSPVLETGAFAAMLSLNIFTRQFNKVFLWAKTYNYFNKNLLKLSLFCKYIILNNFLIFKLFSIIYLQKLIYPIGINYTIATNHL